MLIQIIGPQNCGKTALVQALCPGVVDIRSCMQGMFNAKMFGAPGYYFQEANLGPRERNRLEFWMGCPIIPVHTLMEPVRGYPNPGIWIYEGLKPIVVEPTRVWYVGKSQDERLQELEQDSKILNALRNAGVDNWVWYGEALKDIDE